MRVPHEVYVDAVELTFGADIDSARIVKVFGLTSVREASRRYGPAELVHTSKERMWGNPNLDLASTSHVERQNLTMRMQMRRFTRLTNAYSKKVEYHLYAVALHYAYYNWVRVHTTLSRHAKKPTTPPMAAGLTDRVRSVRDLLNLFTRRLSQYPRRCPLDIQILRKTAGQHGITCFDPVRRVCASEG